jgi:hypothetical protein
VNPFGRVQRERDENGVDEKHEETVRRDVKDPVHDQICLSNFMFLSNKSAYDQTNRSNKCVKLARSFGDTWK